MRARASVIGARWTGHARALYSARVETPARRGFEWAQLSPDRCMDSVAQFLSMGGYATFVWPAFAVCAVVMVALVIASRRALVRDRRLLESLDAGRQRRHGSAAGASAAHGAKSES